MGFYDREYYREPEQQSRSFLRPQSMVLTIIVINVLIFLANEFVSTRVNEYLLVRADTIFHPTQWWRFLTYGFAHGSFAHIFGNMLVLFFLGPPVEQRYGQREFLLFYLVTIVVAGLAWCLWDIQNTMKYWEAYQLQPRDIPGMLGASGGICGVVILMALNFPRVSVYLYGVLEMPMWMLGVLYVVLDTLGVFGVQKGNVAYISHLTGAAFALVYFLTRMRFSGMLSWFGGGRRYRKLKFSVDDSDEKWMKEESEEQKEIDRILQKISEKGQDSLTWNERRILKKASRDYQQKRR